MKFKAQQIADILEGDVVGNPEEEVSKLSKIEEGEKGSLTFLSNLILFRITNKMFNYWYSQSLQV